MDRIRIKKTASIVLILLVLGIISVLSIKYFIKMRNDKILLTYDTKYKWNWYDYNKRIQIRYKNGIAILRKVHLKEKYVFYCSKTQKYDLAYLVSFVAPCKPKSEITTWSKYSDGTPIKLICDDDGTAWLVSGICDIDHDPQSESLILRENFNGFSFTEDLRVWDLSVIDRSVALKYGK